ncbi:hypothetical protein [Mesorhizobium sp. M1396]|uniref:hypothetical protein n=1 Tax=Mesorhizobium sp. M1396 TaxID=2957095 RepID=UPI0033358ECE
MVDLKHTGCAQLTLMVSRAPPYQREFSSAKALGMQADFAVDLHGLVDHQPFRQMLCMNLKRGILT